MQPEVTPHTDYNEKERIEGEVLYVEEKGILMTVQALFWKFSEVLSSIVDVFKYLFEVKLAQIIRSSQRYIDKLKNQTNGLSCWRGTSKKYKPQVIEEHDLLGQITKLSMKETNQLWKRLVKKKSP